MPEQSHCGTFCCLVESRDQASVTEWRAGARLRSRGVEQEPGFSHRVESRDQASVRAGARLQSRSAEQGPGFSHGVRSRGQVSVMGL